MSEMKVPGTRAHQIHLPLSEYQKRCIQASDSPPPLPPKSMLHRCCGLCLRTADTTRLCRCCGPRVEEGEQKKGQQPEARMAQKRARGEHDAYLTKCCAKRYKDTRDLATLILGVTGGRNVHGMFAPRECRTHGLGRNFHFAQG